MIHKKQISELNIKKSRLSTKRNFTLRASSMKIKEVDYLIVDIFHKKDSKHLGRCIFRDFEYSLFVPEDNKWSKANPFYSFYLSNPKKYNYEIIYEEVYISKNDERLINDFIKPLLKKKHYYENDTVVSVMNNFIDEIRMDKKERAELRKRIIMENDLALVKEGSAKERSLKVSVLNWTKRKVLVKNVLYYKRKKGAIYSICCSHCGTFTDIDKNKVFIKNGNYGRCPVCGEIAHFQAVGYKNFTYEKKDICFTQKTDRGVVFRYFNVQRNTRCSIEDKVFEDNIKDIELVRQFVHSDSSKQSIYYAYIDFNGKSTWDNCHFGNIDFSMTATMMYPHNISNVISFIPSLRYSSIDLIAKNGKSFNYKKYISEIKRYAVIEKLLKVGLYNLAEEIVKSYQCKFMDLDKDLPLTKALELNKNQLKQLIRLNGTIRHISYIRDIENINDQWLEKLVGLSLTIGIPVYHSILNKFNYKDLLEFFEKNTGNYFYSDYIDYLRYAEKLGYNLKDKSIRYPEKFKEEHDIAYKLYKEGMEKEKEQKYLEFRDELKANFEYKTKKYSIIVPVSLAEIKLEGQKLHHCVGTYIGKVENRETNILFVRDNSKIDESFYTMEVKNNEIIQVRGLQNRSPTKEVQQFVDGFSKKLQKQKIMMDKVS